MRGAEVPGVRVIRVSGLPRRVLGLLDDCSYVGFPASLGAARARTVPRHGCSVFRSCVGVRLPS
jgi:hypothetical protein